MAFQVFYVARHGQRADHVVPWTEGAWARHDPPLSELGKKQAFELGCFLGTNGKVDRVICSPYLRTLQTACGIFYGMASSVGQEQAKSSDDPVAPHLPSIEVEYGIAEWHSTWKSKNLPQYQASEVVNQEVKFWMQSADSSASQSPTPAPIVHGDPASSLFPSRYFLQKAEHNDTESREAFYARIHETLHALAEKYPRENLLFVTHAATCIILSRCLLRDLSFPAVAPTCSLSVFHAIAGHGASHSPSYIQAVDSDANPESTKSAPIRDGVKSVEALLSSASLSSKPEQSASRVVWKLHRNGDASFLSCGPKNAWIFPGEEELYAAVQQQQQQDEEEEEAESQSLSSPLLLPSTAPALASEPSCSSQVSLPITSSSASSFTPTSTSAQELPVASSASL